MIRADILPARAIRIVPGVTSKKRLFHLLAGLASEIYGFDADRTVEALLERENLGPTGVGSGVALPHARLGDCDKVRGLFVRMDTPIEFGAVDHQPVDLVCALFAPEDAGVDHLKALAMVSRTLRNPDLCATLRANDDVAALHSVLTETGAIHAA